MAKKELHDERLEKGLAALLSAGMAIDAPASASVAQLKSALGRSAEADIAAIFMLGKIATQESLNLLRDCETTATDRDVKKEIKRALFKLSQKGLVVPQAPPPEKKPALLFEPEYQIEAYMSAVDGGGGRLVWIAKPQPKRGLQVIQAMLHDREGLLRFGAVQMKRKELRAMADEIKRQHGVSMIAVPWEFADRIVYEGYEKAKARGQSDLNDFHAIRSVIATGKPKAAPHPVYQKIGGEDFREGSWREQSRRLLEEPELRYWVIVDEWVQDCLAALHEAQSSPLVLNPLQKEERLAGVVRDAVKTLCTGENGQAFKRRMEDMALYFAETGRMEQAKVSLAVAQQVGAGDPGPLDVSFLTGLMQKSFVFFMSQLKAQQEAQQKAEQSSLIVKP
ncbi:MAG: hypothetical protein ABIP88_02110 [Candidatus Binatia bacterium]